MSPRRYPICVLFMLSGCLNTPTLRDGRVLKKGEHRMLIALGANYAPEPLAVGRERLVGETVSEAYLGKPAVYPAFGVGPRFGLGDDFEMSALAHMVPITLGFGLDLALRYQLHDRDGFAAAVAGNLGGFFVLGDQCRILDDDLICEDGKVILSGVLARVGVDLSLHWDGLSLYASPSIGYVEGSRSDFAIVDGREFETEADAVALLLGSTVGVAIGKTSVVHVEVGTYLTPKGRVLWVPALGIQFDQGK